jgi:hypothetical protein
MDVMNQAWWVVYGLLVISESFLPQLFTCPNLIDPLNGDAWLALPAPSRGVQPRREQVRPTVRDGVGRY